MTSTIQKKPTRTAWVSLASLLVGTLIGTMGNSMVSIALPSFMEYFSISLSSAVWSITLYTLTFSVLIPVFGSLSTAIGYKRLFISGMFLVCFSSIMCIFAPNYSIFLFARICLGVGVATVLPTIMGIITNLFPSEIQGKAIGYWALINSLGHAFGPILGGFLLGYFGWQSIFWINIPLGILSIAMAFKVFPGDEIIPVRTFDWFGASGMTILVFSGMLGITQTSKYGINARETFPLWIIAGAALIFIMLYERRRSNPFLDIKLFARKTYMSAIVPISLQAFSQFGLLVSLPIYLINLQGIEKQFAGLVIMSMTLMMAIISPLAGRLSDKWASKWVCLTGTVLIAMGSLIGFFMKTMELTGGGWAVFILSLSVFGTGFGMIQSSSTVAAVQASPKEKSGAATGFFHMIRFINASLGSTVFGIILEGHAQGILAGFYSCFFLIFVLAILTVPFTLGMASKNNNAIPLNLSE